MLSRALAMVAALHLIPPALGIAQAPNVTGAYELVGGEVITIAPSGSEAYRSRSLATGESRRFTFVSPHQYTAGPGWASDSPVEVRLRFLPTGGDSVSALVWNRVGEPERVARRIPLVEQYTHITSGEVRLHAKLVLPEGPGPYPAVVLVHGSERYAATVSYHEPYMLAAQGIATLVYDKRGTGSSDGAFTMDFRTLADDVVAAGQWLAAQPEIDRESIGLVGYSQGGWVAPLAASQWDGARFVVVGFGLAESPADEDRAQTLHALRDAGHDAPALDAADEVIQAVHRIVASNLEEGWETLATLKARHANEPAWAAQLDAGIAGPFFAHPEAVLRAVAPERLPPELDWRYDPMPILRTLEIPMLWILGGQDIEAPPEVTIERLTALQRAGQSIELKVYPDADHGIINVAVQGSDRSYIGYPADYFVRKAAWICARAAPQARQGCGSP